jgi:rhomboid protease GluP
MGLNILLFIVMIIGGVHLLEPTVGDIAAWGGNYKPYTLGGQWWRLITSTFIHVGILHLLLNMYALYQAGIYLEPMLGKARFTVAYLCTGVLASVCSIWWQGDESVSAGASGAIFGLYGVFLALLSTRLIPKALRNALLQSIGIFVVYNLLYGARSEAVDNAAHIGGLISGLVIGYIYYFSFKKASFRPALAMGLAVTATVAITIGYLKDSDSSVLAYQQKIEQVFELEKEALRPFKEANDDNTKLLKGLEKVAKKKWQQAKNIMEETQEYDLNKATSRQRDLLAEYVDLRIKHTSLAIRSLKGDETVNEELQEITDEIESIVNKMKDE